MALPTTEQELANRINDEVNNARQTWAAELTTAQETARAEGRSEGRAEGIATGKAEGENLGKLEIINDLKALIPNAKVEEEDIEDTTSVAEDKKVKAGVTLPCKKPNTFKFGDDFSSYVDNWINFARLSKIQPEYRLRTLLTYLDSESQDRISTLDLSSIDKDNLTKCLPRIKQVMEPSKTAMEANMLLLKAKQEPGESLNDFARRIRKLGDIAFNSEELKNLVLGRIFRANVESDRMSEQLLLNPKKDFKDVFEDALKIEAAMNARKIAKGSSDDETLSILQVQDQPQSSYFNPNITFYFCQTKGHIQKYCPKKALNCFICGVLGHVAKMCPQKGTNMQKNYTYNQSQPSSFTQFKNHNHNNQFKFKSPQNHPSTSFNRQYFNNLQRPTQKFLNNKPQNQLFPKPQGSSLPSARFPNAFTQNNASPKSPMLRRPMNLMNQEPTINQNQENGKSPSRREGGQML